MSCRCLSLIPLLLVLSLNTFAQTIICKDKDNQKPISRVHLSIKSLDGLSIFNGYTNESGVAFVDEPVSNNIIVSSAKKIMSGTLYVYQHPLTGPVAPGPAAIALVALLMSVLILVNLFS